MRKAIHKSVHCLRNFLIEIREKLLVYNIESKLTISPHTLKTRSAAYGHHHKKYKHSSMFELFIEDPQILAESLDILDQLMYYINFSYMNVLEWSNFYVTAFVHFSSL